MGCLLSRFEDIPYGIIGNANIAFISFSNKSININKVF